MSNTIITRTTAKVKPNRKSKIICSLLTQFHVAEVFYEGKRYYIGMQIFTERLKYLMDGMSQTKLAGETGIPQQTLSRILCHEQSPNADIMLKLCCYFEVSSDYFLGLQDEDGHRRFN